MSSIGTYKKSSLSAAQKNTRMLIAEAFRFYNEVFPFAG
jgi:hypothetical protein